MALIILSEPDPREAFLRLMKRIAYIVLPVSILWIKYYPELGRIADDWGAMMNSGITQGKNALGGVCMILGPVFLWHLLQVLRTQRSTTRRNELYLTIGLLLMTAYLLWKAHSATSWVGLFLSLLTMVLLGLRSVNKKVIGAYVVAGIVLLIVAQLTFDIYGHIVDVSGHEETIEGRGRLWEICLQMDTNPIFGAGFESFWLGDRLQKIWEQVHVASRAGSQWLSGDVFEPWSGWSLHLLRGDHRNFSENTSGSSQEFRMGSLTDELASRNSRSQLDRGRFQGT